MATHYVEQFINRRKGHMQRAVCGALVEASEHSTEPSCEPCADFLTADEQALNDLRDMPPGGPMKTEFFDVLADYRPKGSGR